MSERSNDSAYLPKGPGVVPSQESSPGREGYGVRIEGAQPTFSATKDGTADGCGGTGIEDKLGINPAARDHLAPQDAQNLPDRTFA